jgi:two-component system phosphate regulon response regulator PhoB/two-component system alkaline phosphatase synthesis response regulator PhoP
MEDSKYDILIIDDSEYIIKLLKQIIKSKGYSCKAVENLSIAMDELNLHLPKLIFLDVNLPESSGYEFCKKIKSIEKFKNILIYYFTGVSEKEIAIKALETKADGYLKKPFDLSDFNDIFYLLSQPKFA